MSEYETIRTSCENDVLTITLNRPERLNACPPQMAQELFDALSGLGDARAVLLRGEGRAFCSGADLAANAESSISGGERARASLLRYYNPMIETLVGLPVPVVSEVQGPAAGIGCSIALAADFTLVGKSGYFLQAFVNIGLVPDGGSSWLLPRLIGRAQAARMMMLGERIAGEEAARLGLVYACVEDDALPLGAMKAVLHRGLQADLATTLVAEADAQRRAGNSADAAEGAMAFLQKRKPAFTGR